MSMTDRDKKIMLLLIPILLVGAYWFLLLTPKREEASEATATLTEQTDRRDAAQARVDSLSGDRTDFAADYGEIVRLGKAVPPTVDMPTILVQLDAAARGTKIVFTRITAEERVPAATPAVTPPAAPGSGDGSQPAAAGGAPAQSAPGAAAESAGNAVNGANAASSAADSGVNPADTQTSQAASNGALPVGGGTAPVDPATGATTSAAPGLDTVPITLEFIGTFFDLADFTHRIKRYVESNRDDVLVRGRLITIDGIEFKSEPDTFPRITATLKATAYLAPAAEGATAGATPSGPDAVPASGVDAGATASTMTPAATATR
jgi:Tfp pilus assembly protein PilO